MTQQLQGKRYETTLSNRLDAGTPPEVRAFPIGYSGNNARPCPDLIITTGGRSHAIELKRTSVDEGEYFYIELDDLLQLLACLNKYTTPYLAVKFNRRELMVVHTLEYGLPEDSVSEQFDQFLAGLVDNIPDCFDPTVTEKSLRLTKPSTDDWPSARAGREDAEVLAEHAIVDYRPEKADAASFNHD